MSRPHLAVAAAPPAVDGEIDPSRGVPGADRLAQATPATWPSDLRVAVVHEWLQDRSGSEVLFEALAATFPSADLYALSRQPSAHFDFGGRTVQTTAIDRALLRERRSLTLPLMPLAWRRLRPSDRYDVVITSSHAFAKSFPGTDRALHLDYCHTPMRYVWLPELDGRMPRWATPLLLPLRELDRRAAGTVDRFAANSRATAARIEHCYGREATVIFPPVDVDYFEHDDGEDGDEAALAGLGPGEAFAFAVSRHVPYKRMDLAIDAARHAGVPIIVAGDGPERPALEDRHRSDPGVRFVGKVDRRRLRALYRQASVVVFPPHEDFGIVPVEAQAAGTPVVALAAGGSHDTVVDGVTGVLVPRQDPTELGSGIVRAMGWDPAATTSSCHAHARGFARERFHEQILAWAVDAVAWTR